MTSLRILQVAAEMAPYAKAGGLADVIGGLSPALASMDQDVRVLIPHYGSQRADAPPLEPVGETHRLAIADSAVEYRFLRSAHGPGAVTYFLDCPAFFGGEQIYASGDSEAHRFLLLCLAALRLCDDIDWSPQILHCHDWHSAALPGLIHHHRPQNGLLDTGTVLSIHNVGYQGIFPASVLADVGLPMLARDLGDADDNVNLLRAGIRHADAITTVSPTYAREIRSPAYGMGLENDLRQRAHRLTGILNGVDYRHWDPASDPLIAARYAPGNLSGKARCREDLQHEFALDLPPGSPVVGMVSRLVEHKGVDLLAAAAPALLEEQRMALVVLGDGDGQIVAALQKLQQRFPGRVGLRIGYDEALAHRIIAGADMLAVPSRYEPCGLTQMYALRYGTVPVVRATGGLADTVSHFDPATGQGNGAMFLDADPPGLRWAFEMALGWFHEPRQWQRLQANGMAADFSWHHQAPLYLKLYHRLLDLPF